MSSTTVNRPVIIAGGGPVGLAASLELARFHVPSIVVEQHDSTSHHPKTRNLNTRTMEIARGWGSAVYQRLRGIDIAPGWKSPMWFLESIVGQEGGQIDTRGFEGPGPTISAAAPVLSSQDLFEPILRDAAEATGLVDLRFGHQVTDVLTGWSDLDGEAAVAVRVAATGETYTLGGAALVAADGINSTVRNQLGIGLTGEQDLNHYVNAYFRSDIERHVGDRRGLLYFIANQDAVGALQPLDARGRWLCQIAVQPDEWNRDLWDDERVRRWVRAAAGVPELAVEVKSVGLWKINATVADRFAQGRIVLCGDAAHQFPPTGGLGLNTGLQGMHNAMWKLAFCVRGLANWSLLATYEDERREPAGMAIEQSLANARNVGRLAAAAISPATSDMSMEEIVQETRRYGNHLGVEFGTTYHSTAVIADGTTPPDVEDTFADYAPSASPGCRAPHVWLGSDTERLSTHDLFAGGFTVLTGSDGEAWQQAAAEAAQQLQVPITSHVVGSAGLNDHSETFFTQYEVGDGGAVLIRPDGYVAWRCATHPAGRAPLTQAIAQILDRRP
jgi:putative polyketide hydroxylase